MTVKTLLEQIFFEHPEARMQKKRFKDGELGLNAKAQLIERYTPYKVKLSLELPEEKDTRVKALAWWNGLSLLEQQGIHKDLNLSGTYEVFVIFAHSDYMIERAYNIWIEKLKMV